MRFRDTVVAITGAGSGIGADAARRFAAEGARLVLGDIDLAAVQAVATELGSDHAAVPVDVRDEAAVAALLDAAVERFGRLDVLVNNAGVPEQPRPIERRAAEDWQRIIDINLSGVFYGVKHAARIMKPQRAGVIINVASVLGLVGIGGAPAYTAAKHGVIGLTKDAALELARHGIRVVAVAPAFTRTPMISGMEEVVLPRHPLGRLAEPGDIATMILFLASPAAAFASGSVYTVDGAYTAQ